LAGNGKTRVLGFHFISQRLVMLLSKQDAEDMKIERNESVGIMIDMSNAKE